MKIKHISLIALLRFLLSALFAILFLFSHVEAATQFDIAGPTGSERFGKKVVALPNGNIIVTDPLYDAPGPVQDAGAVYLYNGATGALVSMLTGSNNGDKVGENYETNENSLLVLSNGDFVVTSSYWNNGAGAVTLCNGSTGCSGAVSAANSLIGATAGNTIGSSGVRELSNGNYVAISPFWDDGATQDVGAVTFCSRTAGCIGTVSPANSLIGTKTDDFLGVRVTALSNGNYVVANPLRDNGAAENAGAVTWCNGSTGCVGTISAANSLVGTRTMDFVGEVTTALSNGNYVVSSPFWANGSAELVGASTFCNGMTGCTGAISPANSLIGSQAHDLVGRQVTELSNGNYLVISTDWANGSAIIAGAVTLCNGTTGCTGAISPANSLVGSRTRDLVGWGGVVELTNGNFVVVSPFWDGEEHQFDSYDSGAVTLCNGTTGCVGAVSYTNSLFGFFQDQAGFGGVYALPNGNYVVSSPLADYVLIRNGGLVTFCNGTTGCTGGITEENSLHGEHRNDGVGSGGITVLTNGDYVVSSPSWASSSFEEVGAVTRCSGTTGCPVGLLTGAVSSSNSLTGVNFNDRVGEKVIALPNGSYVVASPKWNKDSVEEVGAVTFCDEAVNRTGTVSIANSLTGNVFNDHVGQNVMALTNGNFVVSSPDFDINSLSNAGAITWCNGSGGCPPAITSANSLVGSSANDKLGDGGMVALANGNYIAHNLSWKNDAISQAGAISLGAAYAPTVGVVSFNQSVRGNSADGGVNLVSSYDAVNERLVVGRPFDNKVSLFRPTYNAAASGNWSAASTWDYGAFTQPQNVVIRSPYQVTLDTDIVAAGVAVFPSATLALDGDRSSASDINVLGTLDLNDNNLDMGNNTLSIACAAQPPNLVADADGYVIGNLRRCRSASVSALEFPVGTANGYSPVVLSGINGSGNVNFAVRAHQGAYPNQANGLPQTRLGRWWELTNFGLTQADVRFYYRASDVTGNESNYRVYKIEGGAATQQSTSIDTTNHIATVFGVTNFSDWTLASPSQPTSASVGVSGQVRSATGRGVANAQVEMTNASGETRTAVSNQFGFYRFTDVRVGGTYIFRASAKRYQFAPHVVMVSEELTNLNFIAVP